MAVLVAVGELHRCLVLVAVGERTAAFLFHMSSRASSTLKRGNSKMESNGPGTRFCFDPVVDLPGDLAALCLAFLDYQNLLRHALGVSREWRDAIDGGLPGVWYDVSLGDDARLQMVVQKSRGRIMTLDGFFAHSLSTQDLGSIRLLTNLRVLELFFGRADWSLTDQLSSLAKLEQFSVSATVWTKITVRFPPLPCLRVVRCKCNEVNGLHNLPALTNLELRRCNVDASIAWPASLREVTIYSHPTLNHQVVDRIAALQQPIKLATDWSFAVSESCSRSDVTEFANYRLSFLAGFTTLQHLAIDQYSFPLSPLILHIAAIPSIRKLSLTEGAGLQDEDLRCLSQLTNLQSLQLRCIVGPSSQGLRHLSALPSLTTLTLAYLNHVHDYSSVGLCSHLRELTIFTSLPRKLRIAEVEAIVKLHLLQTISLFTAFEDVGHCLHALRELVSLRELAVMDYSDGWVPVASFSTLLALSLLEKLQLQRVRQQDTSELLDHLVHLPTLRCIQLSRIRLSDQDKSRLREALPRLELLTT